MARTPKNNTETLQKRQALGVTALEVAQALELDARVIYVLESYTLEQVQGLYTEYNKHIDNLGKTSETRAKIKLLQDMLADAESIGEQDMVDLFTAKLAKLQGGDIELMVDLNEKTPKKAKAQKAEAVAV